MVRVILKNLKPIERIEHSLIRNNFFMLGTLLNGRRIDSRTKKIREKANFNLQSHLKLSQQSNNPAICPCNCLYCKIKHLAFLNKKAYSNLSARRLMLEGLKIQSTNAYGDTSKRNNEQIYRDIRLFNKHPIDQIGSGFSPMHLDIADWTLCYAKDNKGNYIKDTKGDFVINYAPEEKFLKKIRKTFAGHLTFPGLNQKLEIKYHTLAKEYKENAEHYARLSRKLCKVLKIPTLVDKEFLVFIKNPKSKIELNSTISVKNPKGGFLAHFLSTTEIRFK